MYYFNPFSSLLVFTACLLAVSTPRSKAETTQCPERGNSGPLSFMAHNSSYPDIDGKFLWTYSGQTYLDAGAANPRMSYPLIAKLQNNSLIRIPQKGSPPENIANLNFGTSNMCCDYAALNWNTKETLSSIARTTPFYIDKEDDLQFEKPEFRRTLWHVCTVGSQKRVYWGFPFYDFPNPPKGAEAACTVVKIAAVRPSKTPVPRSKA